MKNMFEFPVVPAVVLSAFLLRSGCYFFRTRSPFIAICEWLRAFVVRGLCAFDLFMQEIVWPSLATEAARSSFTKAAVGAGFRISSESQVEGGLPFGISVVRTQAVEEAVIDATVIELLHLTRQFQGEYDGWETPLVTQ